MNNPMWLAYAVVAVDACLYFFKLPSRDVPRLLLRIALYVILTGLLFGGDLSPFLPSPLDRSHGEQVGAQLLKVIWWLSGARLLSMSLDKLLLPRAWRDQRLFQEVFGALIFLGAIVAVLGFVFALPIRGLVATSGALAIVLGLAIQSTLSDVFAGLVLNTTEPYHVGDWIVIDDVEGKVVEMNWRATYLLNSQRNIVVVPNSVAAKAKITNINRPNDVHGITVSLDISPVYSPRLVLDALEMALTGCRSLLLNPAPYAHIKSTGVSSFRYEIVGYVDDAGQKTTVSNELFDLCFRHLRASGVFLPDLGIVSDARPISRAFRVETLLDDTISTPNVSGTETTKTTLNADKAPRAKGATLAAGATNAMDTEALRDSVGALEQDVGKLLSNIKMFRSVPTAELDQLALRMTPQDVTKGETIVQADTVMDSLTIVRAGVLSVSVEENGETREIARFGPGDTFGEAGLLEGTAAGVRVTAMTNAVLYQLHRSEVTPLLKRHEDVARQLCSLLSYRQDGLGKLTQPAQVSESTAHSAFQWLMEKVHRLHLP